MTNDQVDWFKWIAEVQSIAQAGFTYSENGFDQERYTKLRYLIAELAAHCSGNVVDNVANIFALEKGYETPKIDVRSFILKEGKLWFCRKRFRERWSDLFWANLCCKTVELFKNSHID